jgi:hypothetical protein
MSKTTTKGIRVPPRARKIKPSAVSTQTVVVDSATKRLDPDTPLRRLAWQYSGDSRNIKRHLPQRALKALEEQGFIKLKDLEGVRVSHLMIVPQFGVGRARQVAEAARLAGVFVSEDADSKDSLTVSFSGPIVDLARTIVGQYLWMNPQDLIRKAVVENMDTLMETMRDFTQEIRYQEAERIRAEIQERELLIQRLMDRSVPLEEVLPKLPVRKQPKPV